MGLVIERKYGICLYLCLRKFEESYGVVEIVLWLNFVLVDFWIMFFGVFFNLKSRLIFEIYMLLVWFL